MNGIINIYSALDVINPKFSGAVETGTTVLPLLLVIAVIVITVKIIGKSGNKKK